MKSILLITILLNFVYSNKSSDSQYVFDFSFNKNAGSDRVISIEVFKSTKNDAILSAKEQEKYNLLEWVSIGDAQINLRENRSFKRIALGFNMEIQMLGKEDKQLIRNKIFEINNIEVNINQIKRKELNQMECTIQFEHTGDAYTLRGIVQDYNRNPLEVWFNYTSDCKEYKAFWNYLDRKNMEDLRILCLVSSSITENTKSIKIDISRSLSNKTESGKFLNIMEKLREN
jgi:hypothetical protein